MDSKAYSDFWFRIFGFGFGRIWADLGGFGRIWADLGGFFLNHAPTRQKSAQIRPNPLKSETKNPLKSETKNPLKSETRNPPKTKKTISNDAP
jgi:hypothetical protein